ncbi:hypothetical protein KR018_006602, partial [Drosophila ironensis]
MRLLGAFSLILAVRLASVFVVQTYYVPDEYWQSLEVAHKLTFGYGYLTWEWLQGIRSYVYPLLIAGLYKILALLQLDSARLLVLLPRILQALLTSYSDYRFYVWTGRRKWALFLVVVSWFWFYTGSRTLANTLETSLTTIALSYFPWFGEGTAYLWPAALSCFLRPTSAVIWIPLAVHHLRKTQLRGVELILKRFLPIGLLVAGLGVAIDSYWHGRAIVTPYEFLKYNVLHNISRFYGTHPWHWYFTVGLPTVLGINFLPFLFGIMETVRKPLKFAVSKQLLISIFLSLVALSAVEHKEFRFVAPLIPLCLFVAADALSRWSYTAQRSILWATALVIIVGNAIPIWYFSTVHQRGPIDLMPKLRDIAQDFRDERDHRANILYLMPCHSTPYFSHIHENVTMRFLTCEPNLDKKEQYKDEADRFFDDPLRWLNANVPVHPITAMPSHVVLFDPLAEKISVFLRNYRLLHRIEHAEVTKLDTVRALVDEKSPYLASLLQHRQPRTGHSILVYQRQKAGGENAFN